MIRIFLIFLFLCLCCVNPSHAEIFTLHNDNLPTTLLNDLIFAERQIFDRIYRNDNIAQRLERLELAVYGAIQSGEETSRIRQLRKALTNVASGGNGLQYVTKNFDFADSARNTKNWILGGYNCATPSYINTNKNYTFNPYRSTRSHRMPPPDCRCYSHRMPPPPPCRHEQNNPITNGDYIQNYSLRTGVKILND